MGCAVICSDDQRGSQAESISGRTGTEGEGCHSQLPCGFLSRRVRPGGGSRGAIRGLNLFSHLGCGFQFPGIKSSTE